jgi:hypothetical protein
MQRCRNYVAMETIANYLEYCVSIVQTVGSKFPHAYLLYLRTLPDDCPLKQTIQIHASSSRGRGCVIAQALSDHPRWFALTLGCGPNSRPNSVSTIFFVGFPVYMYICGTRTCIFTCMCQCACTHMHIHAHTLCAAFNYA